MSLVPLVSVPEGRDGKWRVERFEVVKGSFESMMIALHGRGCAPSIYTRLLRGGQIVMSDTDAERCDHLEPVFRARGHCLINGLGLGMVLGAMLRRVEVSHVTVVEASEEVIRLVGPSYADPRVTIVHADAMTWRPPNGIRFGVVWHDIWDAICSDNLDEMAKLHRRYGRRCDWQGSWARFECRRARRLWRTF